MFVFPPASESVGTDNPPASRPILLRLWRIVPRRVWALAGLVQILITLPFWLYWYPAPFHDIHGDVYRGWPFIYGLDQGDVGGDECGPFITYFRPIAFALDTVVSVVCGLPVTGFVIWLGRGSGHRKTRTLDLIHRD